MNKLETKWNKQNNRKRHVAVRMGTPKPARLSLGAMNHYSLMMATRNSIAKECEPIIAQEREAWERLSSASAILENNSECYGQSLRQVRQKYAGDIHSFKVARDTDCNQELDEVSKVVVGASGHNGESESMEKSL